MQIHTLTVYRPYRFLIVALVVSLVVHIAFLLVFYEPLLGRHPALLNKELLNKAPLPKKRRVAITLVAPKKAVNTLKQTAPTPQTDVGQSEPLPRLKPVEQLDTIKATRKKPKSIISKNRAVSSVKPQKKLGQGSASAVKTTPSVTQFSTGQWLSQIKDQERQQYYSTASQQHMSCTKKMRLSKMYRCAEQNNKSQAYTAGVVVDGSHLQVHHSSMGGVSQVKRKHLLDKLERLEQLANNTDFDQASLKKQRQALTQEINRLDAQQMAGGLIGPPVRAALKLWQEVKPVGHYDSKDK